jgi:hypothetical protein
VCSGAVRRNSSICSGEKLRTPMARLYPLLVQFPHRGRRFLNRYVQIGPMNLIQIDVRCAQPS